ncbi:MAG: phosphoribosyltransferase [Chloroflexi bacterium]|nr:phosphoribosyltransferase [Chloroflexota bacterium]
MLAEEPVFDDRLQSGKKLARKLISYRGKSDVIVLAVSKEGVEVAFPIAQALKVPLDVVISRLLHVPQEPETAFGATTQGMVVLNDGLVAQWGITRDVVRDLARDALEEARHEMMAYRGDRPAPDPSKKTVIIVDDGMAIGFPLLSAIVWAKRHGASRIVVALPVSPNFEVQQMRKLADDVVCPVTPDTWSLRIATYYRKWEEPTDREIKSLLVAAQPQGAKGARRKEIA